MSISTHRITPCLWFDTQAEAAAEFYTSVFENSRIKRTSRYGKEGQDVHGKPPGSVMAVEFEIEGQAFMALNGGPQFKFDEAVSFQIHCQTQGEIDYFWNRLTEGGQEGPCGWLKDKFGLSWQVVPTAMAEILTGPDREGAERVMRAFMQMKKIDISVLKRAYGG